MSESGPTDLASVPSNGVRAKQTLNAEWDPVAPPPIEGLAVRDVKNVVYGNGVLTEIFRPEWFRDEFDVRHVVYVSILPGRTSQWHCHRKQKDIVFPVRGFLRISLYDGRASSPTFGKSFKATFNLHRPRYVLVPVGVWHAIHNFGQEEAAYIVLNDLPFDYEHPDDWLLPAGSSPLPGMCDPES
ncbi:MAG: dTDP-4-dehydrorhamnose 3,5-epimerase family protein [Planctomycetota bacterium]|nr:dTDP-4-dehydrorhamnose 3,5-epimerase family protein [Planctomycetota bacterium]